MGTMPEVTRGGEGVGLSKQKKGTERSENINNLYIIF